MNIMLLRLPRHTIFCSLLLLTVSAKPIYAYPSNCLADLPAQERHYFGGIQSVTAVWGAQASIETQDLDLCAGTPTGGTNISALWVGIDNGYNANRGWIQMGYRRLSTYINNHIYQEAQDTSTNKYYIWDKAIPSGTNTYKVNLYWAGTNASSSWNYYLNGVLQTNSIPFNALNISPVVIQVADEVKNPGNQIAGTVSNPVSWGDVYTKSTLTGAYVYTSLPNYAYDSHIYVGSNKTGSAHTWTTWDTRYP